MAREAFNQALYEKALGFLGSAGEWPRFRGNSISSPVNRFGCLPPSTSRNAPRVFWISLGGLFALPIAVLAFSQ